MSPLPPGIFGSREGTRRGINPVTHSWVDGKVVRRSIDEAKQLMVEAGYPDGRDAKTGKPLVLNYDFYAPATPERKPEIDWVVRQFAKIDIQLEVRATDNNQFQDKVRKGKYQVFWLGWLADYPDAENFMFLLYGPNAKTKFDGENTTNYDNPEYDRLFAQMKTLDDGPEKQAVIDDMVPIVREDAPWTFGYFPYVVRRGAVLGAQQQAGHPGARPWQVSAAGRGRACAQAGRMEPAGVVADDPDRGRRAGAGLGRVAQPAPARAHQCARRGAGMSPQRLRRSGAASGPAQPAPRQPLDMLNFIVRRIAYGVLILLGVNLLTFMLFFTVNTPDDMARLNIGGKRVTQEAIEKWKVERGYDKPLYVNEAKPGQEKVTDTIFWERSVSLFALDFGRSDSESAGDIGHEVATRMWVSLQLALPLFVLQVIASTAFALLLVMFRHSRLDFWGVVGCVLMLSISSLFYIIVGQYLFSRVLKLAPISGYASGWDALKFLVLPIGLSLLARLGGEARLYRAMFLEEIGKDYVRTARAKGLSETVVLYGHVLRNALIPIITSAGSYLPYVFLGSLVFESFFGLPGLGAYVIEAISKQDFAIVRTMVFLGSLLYIVTYVLIDVAYTWVDPRVRLA